MRSVKTSFKIAILVSILGFSQIGHAVPIALNFVGQTAGSDIFSADLNGLGIGSLSNISILDDNDGVGGADGIFSGADIDALFLDLDGNWLTLGDQIFASSFSFSVGTIRPTGAAALQPNVTHPGPTFGSLDATTIDLATATLNVLDGISVADVDVANGFLTLGDGGTLTAFFDPSVPITGSIFVVTGEVGQNETLGANVELNVAVVPEPVTLGLLGIGLAGMGLARRRKKV